MQIKTLHLVHSPKEIYSNPTISGEPCNPVVNQTLLFSRHLKSYNALILSNVFAKQL